MNINELEEKLKQKQADINDYQKVWKDLNDARSKLLHLTEYASSINGGSTDWQKLLDTMAVNNIANLIDRIRSLGYSIRKNKILHKAIESAGFRLLEQVRYGKKDEVYHGLLRIFIAQKQNLPEDLATAFKYNDESFKVIIFSFLGGTLGKEIN